MNKEKERELEEKWMTEIEILTSFDAKIIGYDLKHAIPYYGIGVDVEKEIKSNLEIVEELEVSTYKLNYNDMFKFNGDRLVSKNALEKLYDYWLIRTLFFLAEQLPEKYFLNEIKQVFILTVNKSDNYIYITQMLEDGDEYRKVYRYKKGYKSKDLVALQDKYVILSGIKYIPLLCIDESPY